MPAAISTTLFDAGQGYGPLSSLVTFVDCTLAHRDGRWWMFAGGVEKSAWEIHFFSASLPPGAPLSASGWAITPDPRDPTRPALLAGKTRSHVWDGAGGRHCPAYVQGWDPEKGALVERIYYAGAAENFMGPYGIGYVEWDGAQWLDRSAPVFTANCDWERGSVYEPNLIYHDGLWKLWYVAGANQDDYLVQGYAESRDGRSGWSAHRIVFPPEEKVFDFAPLAVPRGYEAVFARVNLSAAPRPATGLWWCRADRPSPNPADWSEPVRISGPGPWKPAPCYPAPDSRRLFVFHDGQYPNPTGRGIPLHFTLNCLQLDRPSSVDAGRTGFAE